MEIASPAYLVELPTHVRLELSDDAKDEFIHHLRAFMHEEYDYGHESRTLVFPPAGRVDEYQLNTPDNLEVARLWVVSRESELYLFLAGEHEPTETDIEVWERGVAAALSQMGSRTSVEWLAIIEQNQSRPDDRSSQKLAAAATVNGLAFGLVGGCFVSDVPSYSPDAGRMITKFSHWPIQVTGSTECFSWEADGQSQTSMRLRKITALLSLAWDGYWSLREGPRDPKVSWANTDGPLMGHSSRALPEGSLLDTGAIAITAPTWLGQTEAKLLKMPRLGHALLAHHDGLAFRRDHSSMALLAFVSSIEATVQISKKPERCPECKMVLGSGERFKTAVASVVDEGSATLLSDAYKQRSLTAHQARMHGTELRAGSWGLMSLFMPDNELIFTMGTVHAAQEASRKLLFKYLEVETA